MDKGGYVRVGKLRLFMVYAPKCNGLYVSVPKLDAAGYTVSFRAGNAVISKAGEIFLEAKLKDGLYVITNASPNNKKKTEQR